MEHNNFSKNDIYHRLYCFPHSGGSSVVYKKWSKVLDKRIDIVSIDYPGRGKLFSRNCCKTMDELLEYVYNSIISDIIDCSMYSAGFSFFGHSLGAHLAYELARKLSIEGIYPENLFLSGANPPFTYDKDDKIIHELPDDEFIKEIEKYGGIDAVLLANLDVLKIFLPIIKADYAVYEKYRYAFKNKQYNSTYEISSNIILLCGIKDVLVPAENLDLWRKYTKLGFEKYIFDGGHFYMNEHLKEVHDIICSKLLGN